MPSLRTLTTYLTLATLLLSNMAGLVHVGCAGSTLQRNALARQVDAHVCSCHLLQCQPSQDFAKPPKQSSPAEEHDSEHCSICKNFFASRYAIVTVAQEDVGKPLLMQRLFVEREMDATEAIFLCGPSVRGPPQA